MNETLPPVVPKKRGCFFYGCIISLVMVVVIAVVGFLTAMLAYHTVKKLVADYTEAAPAQLPSVELPPEEMKQLQARINAFDSALKAHTNTPPLVLTDRDLNALIAQNPDLKGKCYVTLDGDKIKGQISMPLDQVADAPGFKILHLKGRYLNGNGTFRAAINNGQLSVYLDSLSANGKPAPETFMATFRQQNLAQGFNQGTNAAAFADYQSLEVKDSKLIVTAKEP